GLTGLDHIADLDRRSHDTGERYGDVFCIRRVGLLRRSDVDVDRSVAYGHGSQLPVERAHGRAQPAFVGVADRLQAQDEGRAFFYLHFRVEVGIESVPERDTGDDRQVAVLLARTGEADVVDGVQQAVAHL